MKKPLDARIRRSRNAILKAGMELLNKNNETTLSDIANHAGVGRTTLYRLFETKEQLIKAIAIDCLEVFDQATEHVERDADTALEMIHLVFKSIFPLSSQLEFLMKLDNLAENDPELMAIHKKQQREMMDLIDLAKKQGSINKSLPTLWVTNVVDSLYYAAWITSEEGKYTDVELADLAFNTLCNGVCP